MSAALKLPVFAAALAATLPAAVPAMAWAQSGGTQGKPVSNEGRLAATGCFGQPISKVVIISQAPFRDKLPHALEWGRALVRTLHMETTEDVIRRFLLFREGDACNQIRRAESERILRAMPFIVDARIRAYDDEKGGVILEVESRDDFSLIVEPTLKGLSPHLRGLRLGDSNVQGSASMIAAEWRDGGAYNDVYGFEYRNYQLGAGRNELHVLARRNTYGQRLEARVVRPFYTDLQRLGWQLMVGGTRDPQKLFREGFPDNAMIVHHSYGSASVIGRVGRVADLRLFGLSLTREKTRADDETIMLTPDGPRPDWSNLPVPVFRSQDVTRLNLLLGLRAIRFVTVQGFDALTGAQDMRVGTQIGLMGGKSLKLGPQADNDRFVSSDLYLGFGSTKWFLGMEGVTEARYDAVTREWTNTIGSMHAAWYFRPAIHQTTVVQADWSAASRMERPFQVSLADPTGGVIGHSRSNDPGARRLVLRAEQRLVIPTRFNIADVGLAGFVEGGRLWSERTVPWSVDSPWRGAVGVSLLAAVPPRSRRMWRIDLGVPISSDPRRRFEVRISAVDKTRRFWEQPADVKISRERSSPASLFNWP